MNEALEGYQEVEGFVCPAEFWPALGYTGDARFVAIWWELSGDEASWTDGRTSEIGADWTSYLTLIDHNFGALSIIGLGSSELEAIYKLVIDRETERAWFVPAGDVERVLQAQYPVEDTAADGVGVVSFEDLLAIIERLQVAQPQPSIEAIEAAMSESAVRLEKLQAGLAKRPRRLSRQA